MPAQIQGPLMRERADILRELDRDLGAQYRNQFIREKASVLVEESEEMQCSGLSERYFKVYILQKARKYKKNDLVSVTLKTPHDQGLAGTAIELEPHE